MINSADTDVSLIGPPVFRYLTIKDLIDKLSVEDNIVLEWTLTKFACHSVAVECTVKLVTRVPAKVCGRDARDRHIWSIYVAI